MPQVSFKLGAELCSLEDEGMSIRQIAEERGCKVSTIRDSIRAHRMKVKELKFLEEEQNPFPILYIGDLHMPYEHPNALAFCKEMYDKHKCKTVIQLGDESDFCAASRHNTPSDALSITEELYRTRAKIQDWAKVFPKMTITAGNHTNIPLRMLEDIGYPKEFARSIPEILEFPEGWTMVDETTIGGILGTHGTGSSGQLHSAKIAINRRMSTCCGHLHGLGFVYYMNNGYDTIFGANVGCLVAPDAPAFKYAKHSMKKEILGCVVAKSSSEAYFIPMPDKYKQG